MIQMNIHEAKTHLSRALARVQAGETFVIAKNGRPVARLVPLTRRRKTPRPLGTAKSRVRLAANWNAPLPGRVLESFFR